MDPYYGRIGWDSTFIYLAIVTTLIRTYKGETSQWAPDMVGRFRWAPVKRHYFSMKYPRNIYPHDIPGEALRKGSRTL